MRKNYAATLCLCILGMYTLAQETPLRYFEIKTPSHKKNRPAYTKVSNSLYNTIGFLDSREDTNYIGTVGIGLMKHDAKLKLRMPFQPQLQILVDSLIDSTAAAGELLFQLRDFHFVEESSTRYCYLQVGLYVRAQDAYYFLSILDTVLLVTSTDVLGVVEGEGNHILGNFLSSELTRKPQDAVLYHIQDIVNYDSIEKSRIPVYTATQYVNGIYYNYKSFCNQVPDQQGNIETNKHGTITRVEVDTAGRKVKIKSKDLYAVVYKGMLYIATEYGYYPLEKVHNNLFFTGDVKVPASQGDKNGAQIAFGLIGRAIASAGTKTTYDMIIDPISGALVHLRVIPTPAPLY